MSAGTFTAGTEIWVRGRAARIVVATDPADATIEFSPSGEQQRVDLLGLYREGAIRWEPPRDAADAPDRHLEQVSEAEWAEARRREELLKPLLEGAGVKTRAREIAAREGLTWRTLFRWKRAYVEQGLRGLVPDYRSRGGSGKTRLDEARERLLADVLQRVYLQRTRPTLRHTYEQVLAEFVTLELEPPGLCTVRARIDALAASTRTAARDGEKQARARHAVSKGQFPKQDHPLQTILIDHTPLDLHLVDSTDRTRVIGRPFLTLALDSFTRMAFGYYLTLDPPSYLSVAMCILQGVLPKDDVVGRFGLKQPWPIYGLPAKVHTDNGKDFRSKDLERFADPRRDGGRVRQARRGRARSDARGRPSRDALRGGPAGARDPRPRTVRAGALNAGAGACVGAGMKWIVWSAFAAGVAVGAIIGMTIGVMR